MANLSVKITNPDLELQADVYDLKVEIKTSVGIPKELFVYQRGAGVPSSAGSPATDAFVRVATLSDLDNLQPVAEPGESPDTHYRIADVRLRFTNVADLQEVRDLIVGDLQALLTSLTQADELPIEETLELTG